MEIMKTHTKLSQAKADLKRAADDAKKRFSGDNPAICQAINDHADALTKNLQLTNSDADKLADYACKLHP